MKTSKLKQLAVAGLTALALTYGCTKPDLEKKQDLEKIALSESSKNKVVMFGECHYKYGEDNDFVSRILPQLKEQGFKYLALEIKRTLLGSNPAHKAISDYIKGKIKRKDINPDNYGIGLLDLEECATGWLEMINEAKSLGFNIICYDAGGYSSFNEREEKSFKNLKEMIFNKDPDAKVIIYCGNRHINEKEAYDPELVKWEEQQNLENRSEDGKFKCLAYHLSDYTKGKTLTILLTGYDRYITYCDITLDLDKNECLKNNPKK